VIIIERNRDSLIKSNNVRAVKLFIEWKIQNNKKSVTTRDCGSGFSEYILELEIFLRLGEFMKKKSTKETGTPFRPVKILRWPRCFVCFGLYLSVKVSWCYHTLLLAEAGRLVCHWKGPRFRAAFTNRRSFSFLKKILKLRWLKFSYRHSAAREAYRWIIQNYF